MRQVIVLISLIFIGLISSCKGLQFNELYNGHSQIGHHARGVSISDSLILITGHKGAFTVMNRSNLSIVTQDSVSGASDLRGAFVHQNATFTVINSGKNGLIYNIDQSTIKTVFNTPDMFLDGIGFWENDRTGLVYGDPINEKFVILKTNDFGSTWQSVDSDWIPKSLSNEAGFAASGTGIQLIGNQTAYIATGVSDTARLYRSYDTGEHWDAVNTPIRSGESFGIYAMTFWTEAAGIIAGGSYVDTLYKEKIAYLTLDRGETWKNISNGLPGYISGVDASDKGKLIVATGRLGTYYTTNLGETWQLLTLTPFYTVKIKKKLIVLSGKNGILRLYNFN